MESTNEKSALIFFEIFFKKFYTDKKRGKEIRLEYVALMNAFIEYQGLNADFQEFINQVSVDARLENND